MNKTWRLLVTRTVQPMKKHTMC